MNTAKVSAQFATDGDGIYKDQIYWLKWKNGYGGLDLQTPVAFNT